MNRTRITRDLQEISTTCRDSIYDSKGTLSFLPCAAESREPVLAKELLRLRIAMGGVHNVRTCGSTTTRIVAYCAPANGYAADCRSAESQASDGQAPDRTKDADRQTTKADQTGRKTTERDHAPGDPTDGQEACGYIPNGDEALGVTAQLTPSRIRPNRDVVEGDNS